MNFKLTKLKVIVLVALTIIWYVFIVFSQMSNSLCKVCELDINNLTCEKVFVFNIIPEVCQCGCPYPTSFSKIITDLLTVLAPGIIVYILWSLIQKKEVRGKKK